METYLRTTLFGEVDETAVTLRLVAVPVRRRPFAQVPADFAAVVGTALLAAAVGLLVGHAQPRPQAGVEVEVEAALQPEVASIGTVASDPGPVLASGITGGFHRLSESAIDDDVEDDEIIIFDDTDDVDDDEILIFEEPVAPARPPKRALESSRAAEPRLSARRAAALAESSMKRRQYRKALRYAKQASRQAPKRAEYLLLLGDAYFLAKQRTAGRNAWRKAAALGSAKARSRL